MSMAPATRRIGVDSRTMLRTMGRRVRNPDHQRHDRDGYANRGDRDRDAANADQERREEQRGQRDHVARGGDERGGDVVHVPSAPHRECGHTERQGQHDDGRQHAADDRDHEEVGQRDRVGHPEGAGDRLGQHGQRGRHRQRERGGREDVLAHHRVASAATGGTYRCGSRCRAGSPARRRCCPACRWRPVRERAGPGGLRAFR